MEEQKEKNQTQEAKQSGTEIFQKGFFKKLWYSIVNIEKYPEMATEGVGRAISYLFKIVAILAVVLSIWMTYETYQAVRDGVEYLQNEFPAFSYQGGTLSVETEEPIVIGAEQSGVGKIIVDTKTDSEEQINQYLNEIGSNESGIVVLKQKVLVKTPTVAGSISYDYQQILGNMQITQFNKQDVINYANSSQIITLYISMFITIFIYSIMMYFITTLWYVVMISIVGYITAWLLKIKMRYAAVFNMSVYAITLSVLLNVIYLIINMFIPFTIAYFQVMYVAVATIYLIAAIFIIKSETIKKQAELMKIAEAQAIVKKELEQEKQKEEEKEQNKDTDKKEKKEDKSGKKEEKKKDNNLGEEPEGSNA